MTRSKPALELRQVSFTYDDGTRALEKVDLQAHRGEVVGLLAANGSGKTTLLKVIVGLLRPQSGQVLLEGQPTSGLTAHALRCTVGLVWQSPDDQLFLPSVEEDVAFGPRNLGWPEPLVQARVGEALAAVGASELRQRAIHHLSLGEKKRVAIAGVLAMEPRILLADEPTAGLDPAGETQVLHVLRRLQQTLGTTIVLATHSVDLLPLLADRLYLLSSGRVLQAGSIAEVFSDARALEDAHLRLPYVAELVDQLRRLDGIPVDRLPLTVADARRSLLPLLTSAACGGSQGRGGRT